MQDQLKRNRVIFVTVLNFMAFLVQLIFTGRAIIKSYDDLLIIIISSILSLFWVSAFTVKALRHCNEIYYPSVTLAAMAWPTYIVAIYVVAYLAGLIGYKIL